jgi:hypothetical protein
MVYPNPPCQLSLWEETGALGENPRLSTERWLILFARVRSGNRSHELRGEGACSDECCDVCMCVFVRFVILLYWIILQATQLFTMADKIIMYDQVNISTLFFHYCFKARFILTSRRRAFARNVEVVVVFSASCIKPQLSRLVFSHL